MTDSLSGDGQLELEARRLFTTFGFMAARQGATGTNWPRILDRNDTPVCARCLRPPSPRHRRQCSWPRSGGWVSRFSSWGTNRSIPRRRVAFTTGNAMAALVVLILATGTVAVSPYLGTSLRLIGADTVMATLFVIGAVATMAALTSTMLRWDCTVERRNSGKVQSAPSETRLCCPATPGFGAHGRGSDLRLGGGSCGGVLLLHADAWAAGTPVERRTLWHRTELVRRYGTLSLQHHVLQLAISSVSYMIPLIATLLISPSEVAYFSAAFLPSSVLLIVPYLPLSLSLRSDPGTQANSAATSDEHFSSDSPSSERSCWRWKSLRRWRSGSSALPTRQTERRHCAS